MAEGKCIRRLGLGMVAHTCNASIQEAEAGNDDCESEASILYIAIPRTE